jgi:hypothetical protein
MSNSQKYSGFKIHCVMPIKNRCRDRDRCSIAIPKAIPIPICYAIESLVKSAIFHNQFSSVIYKRIVRKTFERGSNRFSGTC